MNAAWPRVSIFATATFVATLSMAGSVAQAATKHASATTYLPAKPVAQPLVKKGSCPSGYSTSGGYCNPNSGAHYAVPKVGSCPSGYATSGGYCLGGQDVRQAVPKVGSCPSGYSTSGAYCLKSGR